MMEEDFAEHFKISSDRLQEIVALAQVDATRAREIITYPWPDKEVHQEWLDEADVEEIANWVRFVAEQEDLARG